MSESDHYNFRSAVAEDLAAHPERKAQLDREHRVLEQEHREALALVGRKPTPEMQDVVTALEGFINKYLSLPPHAGLTLAIWAAATYFSGKVEVFPYLAVVPPTKRCGKTRLTEVLGCVVMNPIFTVGISEAALFRLLDSGENTLILDETEALKEKKNERSQALVAILNSGYRKGQSVYRCVGTKHELKAFSTFGPKAICAIGRLPDTVADRSIVISMQRRKPGEKVGRYISRKAKEESKPLRERLEELAQGKGAIISAVYENLLAFPDLSDRDEELWQPLLATCSVLAPGRVEALKKDAIALCKCKADSDTDNSIQLLLLSDISTMLGSFGDNVPSAELVSKLKELEDSPWGEPGRELTPNRLARMLKPFGASTRTVRSGEKTPRGYIKSELQEAVSLYIDSGSETCATNQ